MPLVLPPKKRKTAGASTSTSSTASDDVRGKLVHCLSKIIDQTNEPVAQQNDDFDLFGSFVARELKKMKPLHIAEKAKRQLNRVLLDLIDANMENQSEYVSFFE